MTIFYYMATIMMIKWIVHFAFVSVKPFKIDTPTFDRLLHVLSNTFVSIPFRNFKDEAQKSKSGKSGGMMTFDEGKDEDDVF